MVGVKHQLKNCRLLLKITTLFVFHDGGKCIPIYSVDLLRSKQIITPTDLGLSGCCRLCKNQFHISAGKRKEIEFLCSDMLEAERFIPFLQNSIFFNNSYIHF